ncbi:DUF4153 domain-containing protein [Solibacillus sp. FSL R5-0691]|uniref:DUF4153 domain-containing protein n=1 Tax=Solibacillus sp. FSL R5-0691 TaxID=2921653 RepID=UPI0030CACC22
MRFNRIFQQFAAITEAIKAFPLATVLLVVLFIVNAAEISGTVANYEKWLTVLVVAVFAASIADLFAKRVLPYSIAIIFTGLFFWISNSNDLILAIQTVVVVSALMMGFIWRGEENFSARFFHIFKSVLITAFFSIVIFIGLMLIYAAINYLLFPVNSHIIEYIAAIVFGLFMPLFFLSLTMKKEERAPVLEVLLSYVIVPLTMVYAVVLVMYIALHFTDWSKNLLEPLLVSFVTTVLVVYFLSNVITNALTKWFRLIFPKVLLVIVLYQLVVSIMKIGEAGITHGRYFVILFGLFAIIIAVILTFMPKKQWLVAPIFILFSLLSVIPPVDAFTISKHNQENLLQERLQSLGMYDAEVQPNPDISMEDKQFITEKFDYLQRMEYRVAWLPEQPFEKIFGFSPQYKDYTNEVYYTANLNGDERIITAIDGYDYFVQVSISQNSLHRRFELTNDTELRIQKDQLVLMKDEQELLVWPLEEIDTLLTSDYRRLSVEEATLIAENDRAKLQIIVQNAQSHRNQRNAELYVFVQVKE